MQPNYHSDQIRQFNEFRRQLLQHDVDLKRLWNLLAPQGQGWPVGGDGSGGPLVGPWSPYEADGAGCPAANAVFMITLAGPPTSGTWAMEWNIGGTNSVLTSVAYNVSAASLVTNIESHANVGSGDVAVTGGPGNTTNFRVEFQGALANQFIETPIIHFGSLAGVGAVTGFAWPIQIGRVAP